MDHLARMQTLPCIQSASFNKVVSLLHLKFFWIESSQIFDMVFPGYLAKFQSITKYRAHVFWIFISVNLQPPLIFLVRFQFLVENWSKWRHILKNTARIKTIITISVENYANTGTKLFVLLRANCCTNCYYNFNPCGVFENMMSLTPILNEELESGKLMAALNSRKERCKRPALKCLW